MPSLITSVHPKAEADVAPAISSTVSSAFMITSTVRNHNVVLRYSSLVLRQSLDVSFRARLL